MARYIKDFQITAEAQIIHSAVNQYLQNEGYEYIDFDGENVFKKGSGIFSNPTFFKFSYSGNTVRMETWMKYALFPGVYIGELGITGFVGAAVKGPWKKRISHIEVLLANLQKQFANQQQSSFNSDYDSNETQMPKEDNTYEETCVMSENRVNPEQPNTPFQETQNVHTSQTVFCGKCGAKIPATALFCSSCGQKRQEGTQSGTNFSQSNTFVAETNTQWPPAGQEVSRKEFIEKYAQPSLRRNIKSIAILCYVCAGLTFLTALIFSPIGIIDALVLAGLALGMQLTKNKGFAYAILVLSIIEVILSLIVGSFPIWWLVAGIYAVINFNKIEKEYKQFLAR